MYSLNGCPYSDPYGLGIAMPSPKDMVTYSTVASAAVSGWHGFKSDGAKGAAIWGGAGAVVPQLVDRAVKMFKMQPSIITALIGCSIVPAYAISRGYGRPSFGGMF